MNRHHYYVAFQFGPRLMAVGIDTPEPVATAADILKMARTIRHQLCSQHAIPETGAPDLVITTFIPVAAPSAIITVGGAG